MDDFVDAYAVLGVSPRATQRELKAAHRTLVARHHPDVVPPEDRPAATRRVQDVNVAYGLVRDQSARAEYDRLRHLHTARGAADRLRSRAEEADLAARWDELATAAGRWAGAWMRRTGGPDGLSYRAGRALGRWLS